MNRIGDLTIAIKAIDKTKKVFSGVQAGMKKLARIGKLLSPLFVKVGRAIAAAFTAAFANSVVVLANLNAMSKSLGVNIRQAQALFRIVDEQSSAASIGGVTDGLVTLRESFSDARKGAGDLFDFFGDTDIDLGVESSELQLLEFLKALRNVETQSERTAATMAILGDEAGHEFLQMANDVDKIDAAIKRLSGSIDDVPGVMTEGQRANMEQMRDSARNLTLAFDTFSIAVGSAAAPAVSFFNNMLAAASRWAGDIVLKLTNALNLTNSFAVTASSDPVKLQAQLDNALATQKKIAAELRAAQIAESKNPSGTNAASVFKEYKQITETVTMLQAKQRELVEVQKISARTAKERADAEAQAAQIKLDAELKRQAQLEKREEERIGRQVMKISDALDKLERKDFGLIDTMIKSEKAQEKLNGFFDDVAKMISRSGLDNETQALFSQKLQAYYEGALQDIRFGPETALMAQSLVNEKEFCSAGKTAGDEAAKKAADMFKKRMDATLEAGDAIANLSQQLDGNSEQEYQDELTRLDKLQSELDMRTAELNNSRITNMVAMQAMGQDVLRANSFDGELENIKRQQKEIDKANAAAYRKRKKDFERNKKIQKAQAIVNTIAAGVRAFSESDSYTAYARLAAALATGYAQVQKICSTSFEGGTPTGGAGGGSSAGAGGTGGQGGSLQTQALLPQQNQSRLTVNIEGSVDKSFSADDVEKLIDVINDFGLGNNIELNRT